MMFWCGKDLLCLLSDISWQKVNKNCYTAICSILSSSYLIYISALEEKDSSWDRGEGIGFLQSALEIARIHWIATLPALDLPQERYIFVCFDVNR